MFNKKCLAYRNGNCKPLVSFKSWLFLFNHQMMKKIKQLVSVKPKQMAAYFCYTNTHSILPLLKHTRAYTHKPNPFKHIIHCERCDKITPFHLAL